MAQILTERAGRPLVSEKDPAVTEAAIKQIVKKAEDKVMNGDAPQVTNKEVSEIVQAVKENPHPVPITSEPAEKIWPSPMTFLWIN